jgi:hypothetical protein
MNKKEALTIPSNEIILEGILTDQMRFQDAKDWRECAYACRVAWLDPLVAIGYVRPVGSPVPAWNPGQDRGGREEFNYHKFEVTPAGLDWWMRKKTEAITEQMVDTALTRDILGLEMHLKGIGHRFLFERFYGMDLIGLKGVLLGYFEYVKYKAYWRGGEGWLYVDLTEKGMLHFDALPRLELECA